VNKNTGLIAGVVVVVGCMSVLLVHYKQEAQKITRTLEAERYNRLVAEEKVVNTVSKIKHLETELKSSEEKIAKVQAVLKDQKSLNTDMERQFERLSKAKAELENQLRIAIAQPPSAPVETEQAKAQDTEVAKASN
jgi:septal ring factor EnvC (AmiA/AmiB activator)